MSQLRSKALRLLAQREHSVYELRYKLASDNLTELDELLADLIAEGLQSDERFTESFIRSRTQAGYGPRRIAGELNQKGIAQSLMAAYLPEDDAYWQQQLRAVWQKKYHAVMPRDPKAYARQTRFLVQRGFTHSQVMKFLQYNAAE